MVPDFIRNKIGINLHNKKGHPLYNLRKKIQDYFHMYTFDNLYPVVSVEDNFDSLLIPPDHPSRRTSDTFYTDDTHVLRTHTSAHQVNLLRKGYRSFLMCGDVYRKDEIDSTHYPVFHQLEGLKICRSPIMDLHKNMEGLLKFIMGDAEVRKVNSYFPFTNPSWEYEVLWQNRWLEIAGCGIIHPDILKNLKIEGTGWAFGIGLERIAMVLHQIPDIRLFWLKDERFLNQFKNNYEHVIFKEFSSHPPCTKDISFWTKPDFQQTEFFSLIREVAGDLVEDVKNIDTFTKGDKTLLCFRIVYRSMDRTLTNEEINEVQEKIRKMAVKNLNIEIR